MLPKLRLKFLIGSHGKIQQEDSTFAWFLDLD